MTDPLVGKEVIRVSLETSSIHIQLNNAQIQLAGEFFVESPDGTKDVFVPTERRGVLRNLWKIVGDVIGEVNWSESGEVDFTFRSNFRLVVPFVDGQYRGSILSASGDCTGLEEF